jgi:hypothetical protein
MKAWIARILPAIAVVIAGVLGYLGGKFEPFKGPIPAADKLMSAPAPKVAAPAPVVIPVATVPVVVAPPVATVAPPPAPVVAAPAPAEKPKPKKAQKKRDNGWFLSNWKLSI